MIKLSDISLDIDKGDILLGGKFKNQRVEVEEFGENELGQPTVNGKSLLNFRIEKDLPEDKMSSQTKEEIAKESGWLNKITEEAFIDEMQKISEGEVFGSPKLRMRSNKPPALSSSKPSIQKIAEGGFVKGVQNWVNKTFNPPPKPAPADTSKGSQLITSMRKAFGK